MFQGLDEIDWSSLSHAYGEATDLPKLIRNLVSPQAATVDTTIDALFGNIWHQGTVYPASAPAVPFLADALGAMNPRHQAALLTLFGALAQGHGYYDAHRHLSFAKEAMEKSWVSDPDATLVLERSIVRNTTLAVFAQWELFENLLSAPERPVRMAALYVLSILGQCDASAPAGADDPSVYLGLRPEGSKPGSWARRLAERADSQLDSLSNPVERAAWLRVLVQIGRTDHKALALDDMAGRTLLERYVILVANAFVALAEGLALPDIYATSLAEFAANRSTLINLIRDSDWPWDEDLDATLLLLFGRLSDETLDGVAASCAEVVKNGLTLFNYEALLHLIFGKHRPRIPFGPCPLSSGRRTIARALLAKPTPANQWWFWDRTNGNASGACKQFGVPHNRMLWLLWLGLRGSFSFRSRPGRVL